MPTRNSIPWAILALVLWAGSVHAAESLSVRLQKAIFAEETEGNLEAAIQIYEKIVEETDTNKPVAAQAQYRLGVCQLKLGKKEEAAAAFLKLIDQFSNAELVAKSRERLAELGQPAAIAVVRKLWTNAQFPERISADGRYFAFTDWDTGDLAVRDLMQRQTRRLTSKGSWTASDDYAACFVFSPKGNSLAYLWTDGDQRCEVKIASLENSEPRSLLKYTGWFQPEDWSTDGQQLAALVWEPEGQNGILTLVSLDTGATRELRRAGSNTEPAIVRFSPNGQFLAYTRRPNKETPEADLYLVSTESGTETPLTDHLADDRLVGWTTDGRGVIFTSDRRGTIDLWFQPITNEGEATHEAVMLKANIGEVQSLGLTDTGAFYYAISGQTSSLYETAIDVNTGRVLAAPKEIPSRFSVTKSIGPKRLSPDGRFLVFVRSRGSRSTLQLEDIGTGAIREIPIRNVRTFSYPKWSEDGSSILVHGFTHDLRHGVYLVDAKTTETRVLSLTEPRRSRPDAAGYGWFGFYQGTVHYAFTERHQGRITLVWHDLRDGTSGRAEIQTPEGADPHTRGYALSPNGKILFYIRPVVIASQGTHWVAVRRDLTSRQEMEFFRSTNEIAFAFSPRSTGDSAIRAGRPIVMSSWAPGSAETVIGVDVTEYAATERFRVELPPRSMIWPHWFGGKAHLLFTSVAPGEKAPLTELWAILGESGEIKKTELAMPRMRIVGNYGDQLLLEKFGERFSEVWVLENFLPPMATAVRQ